MAIAALAHAQVTGLARHIKGCWMGNSNPLTVQRLKLGHEQSHEENKESPVFLARLQFARSLARAEYSPNVPLTVFAHFALRYNEAAQPETGHLDVWRFLATAYNRKSRLLRNTHVEVMAITAIHDTPFPVTK